ncbi:MAG: flagellar biosynthetic protein FliO [Desulfobulbaceae bacterium]|jgi:flagellar protein FliO/FliZ|nr:flagellar biosynthetic protein FliO [Desulfobulbaceae bacterium]
MRRPGLCGAVLALIAAAMTIAAIFAPERAFAAAQDDSLTVAYLRMIAALALVIGIMFIMYALLKKRFSLTRNRDDSAIRVLETRLLAPRKSLCLVEARGEAFLLAINQDGISLLAALGRQRDAPRPTMSQSFDSILNSNQAANNSASPL